MKYKYDIDNCWTVVTDCKTVVLSYLNKV